MVRPSTPGSIVVLAATIILILVSVSTPIIKSIYFLNADITVSVASVNVKASVNLGALGYCLSGIGTKAVCQGPQLGYELSSNEIFGNTTNVNLPNSLIKWLTYVLIIHPIAAGLGLVSFILGIASHFREFSRGLAATWLASIASTVAMLAFIFDIVLFSIAKSRINAVQQSDVAIKASLGNGIWLTLVGFILMFTSGCFFGFGHRCINRRPREEEKDRMRPRLDYDYASAARKDAQDLEKAEAIRRNGGGNSGLPAFPEEQMPLTAIPKANASSESVDINEQSLSHSIAGVGTGYGYGPGAEAQTIARPYRSGSEQAEPFNPPYIPHRSNSASPSQTQSPHGRAYGSGSGGVLRGQTFYNDAAQQGASPYGPRPMAAAAPLAFPASRNEPGSQNFYTDITTQPTSGFVVTPYPAPDAYHYNHEMQTSRPYIPPITTSSLITITRNAGPASGGFYDSAVVGRQRQSMSAAHRRGRSSQHPSQHEISAYDGIDTEAREQPFYDQGRNHIAENSALQTQPDMYSYGPTTAVNPSPTYDMYDTYYQDSPVYTNAATGPPSIPYTGNAAYPTYSANLRR